MNMPYFKPRSQASQNSFIKQYQDFLQKNRKNTASILEPKKQQAKQSYSPLFKQPKLSYSKLKNLRLQTSPSPKRQQCYSLSSHHQTDNSTQIDRSLSQYEFEVKDKSVCSASLFQDTQKQVEEHQQQPPELQQGIVGILGLIKKEKQVILNDMKQMTKQMNNCKQQYEEIQKQKEELQHKFKVAKDGNEVHARSKDKINDTYLQMIQLLRGLQVQHNDVLPELEQSLLNHIEDADEDVRIPDKDEIIILQKLIIKKLVKKIEDQKQLNQLLQTKIKEYEI
ncbi:unnamed protein product (macronuclear) [Paramecium tetraurelia]|uniref:Nucleoporin Nup54 alpha-helical domain-containing protein n=1 Tax=Paramecium tetraurelia TaxID=5888 RepID=A0C5M9_PARTE|nr:uncharacterized protein GSPATT00035225001 [Paramecium tetraurelia]CAK66096.1 unnamed protein product [Paramecium tetraurelia]|eukprot:XP_001433493.1 hypothetical protein (macronuclear) [Paramecium tetraurelia strain d4-2]